MERDTDESSFTELRRLAGNVDKGVLEVKSRIENCEDGIDLNSDETPALLFLQQARKDIKEISSNRKKLHEDFIMRSSAINSVGDLFASVLDSFKNRLETVETFTEKYGYKRPTISSPCTPESNSQSDEEICVENNEICSLPSLEKPETHDGQQSQCESESINKRLSDPHTPRLEDFGLSEHTLFNLKAGNYNFNAVENNSQSGNNDDTMGMRGLLDSPPKTKSFASIEISTPKLESYGLSEDTLFFLNNGNKTSEKENLCSTNRSPDTPTPVFKKSSKPSYPGSLNFHKISTNIKPTNIMTTLGGNIDSSTISLSSDDFFTSLQQRNLDLMCKQKFEKFTNVRPDSPKTPPLPELQTHFFIDPPKIEIPIADSTNSRFDSPKTPPLPELQTCILTEIDSRNKVLRMPSQSDKVPSALKFTETTPPFPKLSSRYL